MQGEETGVDEQPRNSNRPFFVRLCILIAAASMVASCAQYSVKTNKAPGFSGKIDSVYVWSGIGSVTPFTKERLFAGDSFENYFNTALAKKLDETKVVSKLKGFSPSTDRMEDLGRFEGSINPRYRLLVLAPKYTTITAKGITNVDVLHLDISLIRVGTNERIWRSEIVVDCNTAPGTAWREDGANKLAGQIIDALKQDGLL